MQRLKTIGCVAAIGLGAVACENTSSIYRTSDLSDGRSVITDAKQRIIINTPARSYQGANQPERIVCAEPSPDVAQALSEAISAAVKVDVAGQGSGSADVSRSAAASVAQLGERLAAIQLLRDGLYRACEAYSNGAMTDVSYAMVVGRIDDVMITLLSGEMAAGAFGRELMMISGDANARTMPTTDDGEIKRLREQEVSLTQELASDKAAAASAQADAGAAGLPANHSALVKVNATQAKLAATQDQLRRAERRAAASGAGGAASGGTGLAARGAADAVEHIHRAYLNDDNLDAFLVACVTALSRERSGGHAFSQACQSLFGVGPYGPQGSNVKTLFMTLIERRQDHAVRMSILDTIQRQGDLVRAYAQQCGKGVAPEHKEFCATVGQTLIPVSNELLNKLIEPSGTTVPVSASTTAQASRSRR